MSLEYKIWEMLAGVGNYSNYEPVKNLNNTTIIRCFEDDPVLLISCIEMRDQGLLEMKDGRVVLYNCNENTDVVKENFPIGSKQQWESTNWDLSTGFTRYTQIGKVIGYGMIQDYQVPNLRVFVVICKIEKGVECVHPNKFEQ